MSEPPEPSWLGMTDSTKRDVGGGRFNPDADIVTIKFSRTVLDEMLDKWSPLVSVMAVRSPSGEYDLHFRRDYGE